METDKLLVKLYILGDNNSWEDKNTGFLSFYEVNEPDSVLYKMIIAGETDETNYEFDLSAQVEYQLQQETLITWVENEREIALSFQSPSDCQAAYSSILRWTKGINNSSTDESGEIGPNQSDLNENTSTNFEDFPTFNYEHLQDYMNLFSESVNSLSKQRQLSLFVEKCDIVNKLVELFKTCESLEDQQSLEHIFIILKVIMGYSKVAIYESILNDVNLLHIIGMMEYNPDISPPIKHREIIESSKFIEVIPIKNPELKDLILHTHRLQYLQDIILPTPVIFEERGSVLSSFLFFRKNEIMEHIFEDEEFLSSFFKLLIDENVDDCTRKQSLKMFIELCGFMRVLQNEQRALFVTKLLKFDVVSVIEFLKGAEYTETRASLIEIICKISDSHVEVVRHWFLQSQDRKTGLIGYIIDQFVQDPLSSSGVMALQILRSTLDCQVATKDHSEKSETSTFLSYFYIDSIGILTALIFQYTLDKSLHENSYVQAVALEGILDILVICINLHTFYIKNYIFKSNVIQNIALLLYSRHMFLAHSAVRVIRRCLSTQDEFYYRHLTKEGVIDKLVGSLKNKHYHYNIVNSAIVEAFDFIRLTYNKFLFVYLAENFRDFFESVSYTPIFKKLCIAIDQSRGESSRNKAELSSNNAIENDEARVLSWIEDESPGEEESIDGDKAMPLNGGDDNHILIPPLRPKFDDVDDSVVLRSQVVTSPQIKIALKRSSTSKSSISSEKSTPLVDYPDEEDEGELPPCDDYVVEKSDNDQPSPKKPKVLDIV